MGVIVARELIRVTIARRRRERVPVIAGIGIWWIRRSSSSRGEIIAAFRSRTVISALPEGKPQSHLPLGTAGWAEELELVIPIGRRVGPVNEGGQRDS